MTRAALAGSRAILVLGMHRSGTSALTGVLARLGAAVGDAGRQLPAAPDNPTGFWEHAGVFEIHEWLLKALGSRWDDIGPMPDGWLDHAAVRKAKRRLRTLLEDEMTGQALWTVKDPRLCRLLPMWQALLEDMRVDCLPVLCVRHPAEVAASLAERDAMPATRAYAAWLRHTVEACAHTDGKPRCVVSYAHLLEDWRAEVDRIGTTHAIAWPVSIASAAPAIETFLAPGDRNHVAAAASAGAAPALVTACHDALLAARDSDDGWQAFDALSRDIREYSAVYDAAIADVLRARFGVTPDMLGELQVSLAAQAEWFNTITAYWIRRRESDAAFDTVREALDLHVAEARRAHAANASLHEQLAGANAELQRVNVETVAAHAANASLHEQLAGANSELQRTIRDADAAHAANASLHEQMSGTNGELERQRRDAAAAHAANASLHDQLAGANAELRRVLADAEEAHAANASISDQLAGANAELQRVRQAEADAHAAAGTLHEMLAGANTELKRVNATLAADQAAAVAADARGRSLRWLVHRLLWRLTHWSAAVRTEEPR